MPCWTRWDSGAGWIVPVGTPTRIENAAYDSLVISAGLHLLVRLDSPLSEAEIVRRAADHGVLVAGASPCYMSPPAEPRLMIGFAATPTEQIDEGIARLAQALRR